MNNIKILALLALLVPSTALAQEDEHDHEDHADPLPNLGVIEEMGYYSVSPNYFNLPLPTNGKVAHFFAFSMGYMIVDESLLHLIQVDAGFGDRQQLFGLSYALAIGPRSGNIHGGFQLGLGYAHLYDDQAEDVHALYTKTGLIVISTLWIWPSLQWYLNAGMLGLPLSSTDYTGGRALAGWYGGFGVAASLD